MSDLFKFSSAAPKGTQGRDWIKGYIRTRAEDYPMVAPSCKPEVFLRYCIDGLEPPADGRDTRRQRLIRALRVLDDNGQLPFAVIDGLFVFEV